MRVSHAAADFHNKTYLHVMTIRDVLICLYRLPLSSIVDMLNEATYATQVSGSDQLIINTGVTFTIQTGTTFELLYDLVNHMLIYQPNKVFELPRIAGLECFSHNRGFYNAYSNNELIAKVLFDDSAYVILDTTDNEIYFNQYVHSFEILNEKEQAIDSFPLKNHLEETVYYFGNVFNDADETLGNDYEDE